MKEQAQRAIETLTSAIDKLEALRVHKSPEVRLQENLEAVIETWYEDETGEETDLERPRRLAESIIKAYPAMTSRCGQRRCALLSLAIGVYGLHLKTGPLIDDLLDEISEWEEGADLPSLPRAINEG